eukprot:754582-Hanusia_phi.AAC.2
MPGVSELGVPPTQAAHYPSLSLQGLICIRSRSPKVEDIVPPPRVTVRSIHPTPAAEQPRIRHLPDQPAPSRYGRVNLNPSALGSAAAAVLSQPAGASGGCDRNSVEGWSG